MTEPQPRCVPVNYCNYLECSLLCLSFTFLFFKGSQNSFDSWILSENSLEHITYRVMFQRSFYYLIGLSAIQTTLGTVTHCRFYSSTLSVLQDNCFEICWRSHDSFQLFIVTFYLWGKHKITLFFVLNILSFITHMS